MNEEQTQKKNAVQNIEKNKVIKWERKKNNELVKQQNKCIIDEEEGI